MRKNKTDSAKSQQKKKLHHLEIEYTDALADRICEVIAITPKGLVHICDENPWMPKRDTLYKWLKLHKHFADNFTRAKQKQVHEHAEEILVISDACTVQKDEIEKAKLRVDARKWYTSKLMPRLYGDNADKYADVKEDASATTKESLKDRVSKLAGWIAKKKKIDESASKE